MRYFPLYLNLVIVLAIPVGLLRFDLYKFLGSVNRRIVIHEQVFFSFRKYQTTTGHKFLSRMSIYLSELMYLQLQSEFQHHHHKYIPEHQTYLPFRARTNKIRVALFVVFSPNVNTVVCTEHNLTFIWKYYFFPVVVYCSKSTLFTPLDSLFLMFASRTTIFFFANLLLYPS